MDDPGLVIEVGVRDGVATLVLRGPLELATVGLLERRSRSVVRLGGPHLLLVDLRGVSLLDSSGLQALLVLRREVRRAHGYTVLVRGGPQVQRVFEVAGLTEAFQFIDAPQAAPPPRTAADGPPAARRPRFGRRRS